MAEENTEDVSQETQNVNELVERIGTLEKTLNEEIEKKKRVMGLVRDNLGISEISEDTLKSFAENSDETVKKENKMLQEKLQMTAKQVEELQQNHAKEIDTMVLKDTLRGLGVSDRTVNEVAFNELTNIVLAEAERDGANFIFRDEEGRTRFTQDGKPMTVQDRIEELSRGDRSFLFKEPMGGGSQENAPSKRGTPSAHKGSVGYIKDNFL